MATINDKNRSDFETNAGKISKGKIIPANILLEKSGIGNRRNPPINPKIIEKYAVFSLNFLL